MHGRKVGLSSQMRCLLLNYAHGLNRPAGLVGRGHGRCTGGRGADPHTPSAAGKCCWPGHRRPRPPRSFFPQILQTVKSIQWWPWYSSVNNNKKKEQEKLPEAINLQFKPCFKWACRVFFAASFSRHRGLCAQQAICQHRRNSLHREKLLQMRRIWAGESLALAEITDEIWRRGRIASLNTAPRISSHI